MSEWKANNELIARLQDLHRGLHEAMDAFIKDKDCSRGETILRQMDQHLTETLNQTKLNNQDQRR